MSSLIDARAIWAATPEMEFITTRAILPHDVSLIYEMHQRLLPDTIYSRFLAPRIPTLDAIQRICLMEPENGAGFVATTKGEVETVVGHAYYACVAQAGEQIAEVGIVVADHFQGQGIGRRLWQELLQHAHRNRIARFRVLFDPNNIRVLRLLKRSGLAYQMGGCRQLRECLVTLGQELTRLN